MMEEKFLELVQTNKGFEITLGFCDDIDHFIGGTGDTIWYYIQNKSKTEFWMAKQKDGVWSDKHYRKKGKSFVAEDAESGYTISKIVERLYFGHDFIAKDGRKPSVVEKHGLMVDHYTYRFGELAYEISRDYGVTVSHSNINDLSVGYYARTVKTGADVKAPKV